MKDNKDIRLYNILLPLWLIIWVPSWLWLILIPGNYLIDRLVVTLSLKGMEDRNAFCRKHTWKICLAGFFSDFVGCLILLPVLFFGAFLPEGSEFWENFYTGVMFNPFANILSLILVLAAIAVAAWIIYRLDRKILTKAGLAVETAKKAARNMAIFTAPYLLLVPFGPIMNLVDWI